MAAVIQPTIRIRTRLVVRTRTRPLALSIPSTPTIPTRWANGSAYYAPSSRTSDASSAERLPSEKRHGFLGRSNIVPGSWNSTRGVYSHDVWGWNGHGYAYRGRAIGISGILSLLS